MAVLGADGEPQLSYESVDTSLMTPRPRLYGLVGAEVIEEVWKQRQAGQGAGARDGNGTSRQGRGCRCRLSASE